MPMTSFTIPLLSVTHRPATTTAPRAERAREPNRRPGDPAALAAVRHRCSRRGARPREHRDPSVTRMWQTLLSILDQEGDLGVTSVDRDAVQGDAGRASGKASSE